MRATLVASLLSILLAPSLTISASAAQTVSLKASLVPERLGGRTTLVFGFEFAPTGTVPSPLAALELRYPANIGLVTSGLGIVNCTTRILENLGPAGCPADSLMGHGSGVVEIPFGPELIREAGEITIWMGPIEHGHLTLLFFAYGHTPVLDELIFPGVALGASRPYGGNLITRIPPIAVLPEAPYGAVVKMLVTLGPLGIVYLKHARGKTTSYHPLGLQLPTRCPHGGFPFATTFHFLDGSQATAHTAVPCPHQTRFRRFTKPRTRQR
jgi:hypothetical protein